jgi:SAP domain
MSREIDMENLSDEDIIYLADRGRLPDDVDDPREQADMSEPVELDTEYIGDVGAMEAESIVADEEVFSEYEDMTVNDLKAELSDRGLPTSGTKAELIARLEENDQPAPAEELVEE